MKYLCQDNVYQTKGLYDVDDLNDKVTVTELPVGLWTQKFKDHLESLIIDKANKSKKQCGKWWVYKLPMLRKNCIEVLSF